MENASKALLIAGGFLITILFLSLVSYLFTQMRENTSKTYEAIGAHEITEFNQQFLNYAGRDEITIQEVVSIVNLAKDNNKSAKRPTIISVYVDNKTEDWTNKDVETLNGIISSCLDKKYECASDGVKINEQTLYVTEVFIKTKP